MPYKSSNRPRRAERPDRHSRDRAICEVAGMGIASEQWWSARVRGGNPVGHPLIKKVPSLAGGDHIHLRLGRPGDIADRQGLRMRGCIAGRHLETATAANDFGVQDDTVSKGCSPLAAAFASSIAIAMKCSCWLAIRTSRCVWIILAIPLGAGPRGGADISAIEAARSMRGKLSPRPVLLAQRAAGSSKAG
jgi:hypothetical protein